MLILLIVFSAACLYGMRFAKSFPDYLGKSQTTAVKGIFAGIIMFSHFRDYITLSNSMADRIFNWPIQFIGQIMVVMFFFYSGYGIAISSRKNRDYFNHFFRHRILRILLYYDLSVVLFIVCGILQGRTFSVRNVLFSLIGWESVGNSPWFVFAILFLYISVWIAVKLQGNTVNNKSIILVIVSCLLYMFVLSRCKDNDFWYDTIMTFPAGLCVGYHKERFDQLLSDHYFICVAVNFVFLLIGYLFHSNIVFFELMAVAFAVLFAVMTYKVRINNSFLAFMGKYSFEIYLLQRIPAMLLQNYFSSNVVYFIFFAVGTIICAIAFNECCKKVLSFL